MTSVGAPNEVANTGATPALRIAPPVSTSPPASNAPPRAASDRAANQDPAELTLEAVYRAHLDFVRRSLIRLGVRAAELDDATHDVFLVVARRLEEFEGRSTVRTWIFAIAMHVARGIRRDAARLGRKRHAIAQVEAQLDSARSRRDPFGDQDAARTLHALLEVLDDDKRAVFIMSELEQMTANEIAEVVGAPPATVYSRLRLARKKLDRAVKRLRAREARKEAP